MKVEQYFLKTDDEIFSTTNGREVSLVIGFGRSSIIKDLGFNHMLRQAYPEANIVLVSTAEYIGSEAANTDKAQVTAFSFSKIKTQALQINIDQVKDSFDAGAHISAEVYKDELKYLMLFSDDQEFVNGNQLLTGLHFNISEWVPITGSVATSGNNERPCLGLNGIPANGNIIAIAFSGQELEVSHGIGSGWTPLGTERYVSKCQNGLLQKLDNITPWSLYRQYLEGLVDDVESSLIGFPMGIRKNGDNQSVIRKVLGINERDGSVLFAGDFQEGDKVRMMKTSVSKLIDSARQAAYTGIQGIDMNRANVQFVTTCNTRKRLLNDWNHEEREGILNQTGKNSIVFGMRSTGEFCPQKEAEKSQLHNQSIVVTSIQELE